MIKTKNIVGIRKYLFAIKVKVLIFFYYLPEIVKGKISIRRYILFLRRLLYFLSKIYHNKFVKIDNAVRMGLYIPRFPSRAFFTACRKFIVFDEKPPCTTALVSVTSTCRFNCEHCFSHHFRSWQ